MNKIKVNLDAEFDQENGVLNLILNTLSDEGTKFLQNKDVYMKGVNQGTLQQRDEHSFSKEIRCEDIVNIHSLIRLGGGVDILVDKSNDNPRRPILIKKFTYNDKLVIVRTTQAKDRLVISYFDDYEGSDEKISEYFIEKKQENIKRENVIFFEKKSLTYGESAYTIFNKFYKDNPNFYFVLSEKNPDFPVLKEKFGEQLVGKGTKRMIDVLVACKLIVSSELPTHLVADRNVEYDIMDFVYETPYFFLQHGIMFSKPILNPMAKGFWKKNIQYNLVKTVVSSDLEKEEFFKVGFTDSDLSKTGLATLDNINRNCVKTKIAYMPTYRSWEEFDVYNDNIKKTTYYQDIMDVIDSFRKIGMIDRLTIVPHPKFAEALKNENVECDINCSYTDIRDEIQLLITDFSSVSYDAHFRGAYIIYLWNRRAELEQNYKSKSPLTAGNCNGVPVYSFDELEYEVMYAEKNDYVLDEFYQRNFKRICEFDDFNNSQRIYDEICNILESIDVEEENE